MEGASTLETTEESFWMFARKCPISLDDSTKRYSMKRAHDLRIWRLLELESMRTSFGLVDFRMLSNSNVWVVPT